MKHEEEKVLKMKYKRMGLYHSSSNQRLNLLKTKEEEELRAKKEAMLRNNPFNHGKPLPNSAVPDLHKRKPKAYSLVK